MPRSEKKKISDMLDIISNDETLRREFAQLLLSVIKYDLHLRHELTEIVSRELANKMSGY